jgi:two-component system, OmpR family, sensor histidine kinase TctE
LNGSRGRQEQRSLFGEILDWMLAPLLLLWPMSLGLTWLVAQGIAHRPYDRALADVVLALARQSTVQVSTVDGPAPPDLKRSLERTVATLLSGDDDQVFFQVLGARGELLAGDARLPLPQFSPFEASRRDGGSAGTEADGVRWRDDLVADEPVRVAWLALPGGGGEGDALVQVAETTSKRQRLATEIIKGVLLPQFVILPLAVLLVWVALAGGLRPLVTVQQRIRRRDSTDLSPIDVADVPEELSPLVASINDLLQRLDKTLAAQRHFLADAAHQLKTPLAGLRTQAELAVREIEAGRGNPAAAKHSLEQIAVSSQRAAHMVDQLLAMARADAAAGALPHPVLLDLGVLVREVLRDFVAKALERRIDLGYEGPEAGPPGADTTLMLHGEPVLLGELVRNLVDNALQYTPSGGTVTVRVLADPFGQVVVLQVEDTGPGIPPHEREAVFRPFYRALGTAVDGSGLGLAIVQEIARRHGASVSLGDARARDGGNTSPGALFTVRFPLAKTSSATGGAGFAPSPARGSGPG